MAASPVSGGGGGGGGGGGIDCDKHNGRRAIAAS